MGTNASALEKEIGPEQFSVNEHYFGLFNFGNTCYCNSVLQALYFCHPFRENVLEYKSQPRKKGEPSHLSGIPLPQPNYSEEEGQCDPAQGVHHKISERN